METQSYQKTIKTNWIPRLISFSQKRKVISLIILVVIAGSVYGIYEKFFNLSDAERAQKELTAAVVAVGKHMVLPEGDEPVLAKVTDAEALTKQQAFFAGAIDGDQLLLFPKSLKAVIYSPSRDKIINAGPIEQNPASVPASASAKNQSSANGLEARTQKVLTVEVRNGTETIGLAASIAEKVGAISGFAVASVTDASNKKFTNTVIMSTVADARVAELAKVLGADVVETVAKEKSSADVLIVVGADSESH